MATTGIKGVGDLLGKFVKGAVTKESAVKPEYDGNGWLVLEPTYKFIILVDVAEWSSGITIEDRMFYACSSSVNNSVVSRKNLSSAALGGKVLMSPVAPTNSLYAATNSLAAKAAAITSNTFGK